MAATIVTLEPQNIHGTVQSLKTEFANANLAGVETTAGRGTVYVKMPLPRLSNYRFTYDRGNVSWRTPKKKIVIQVKGFAVEQHTDANGFHIRV